MTQNLPQITIPLFSSIKQLPNGLPVAAYPVTGPIYVIGTSKAGALYNNLTIAVQKALKLSRKDARAHAETFSRKNATDIFENFLVWRQKKDEYKFISNPYKGNSGVTRS